MVSKLVYHWDFGSFQYFCAEVWPSHAQHNIYVLSVFVVLFILPISIAIVALLKTRLNNARYESELQQSLDNESSTNQTSHTSDFRLSITLLTVFGICWLPIHLLHVQNQFVPHLKLSAIVSVLRIVAYCLAYSYSALTPIIGIATDRYLSRYFCSLMHIPRRVKDDKFALVPKAARTLTNVSIQGGDDN